MILAIEMYRNEHGEVPQTLGQLTVGYLDGVPMDPFDGQPLKYRVEADAYVVYGVGENRIDDGGYDEDDVDLMVPTSSPSASSDDGQ